MAMQSEGPGQLQEFLDILKRRKWQVVLPTLVILSLGIFAAVVVPKKFLVTTQVELRGLFLDDKQQQQSRDHTIGVAENAPQQLLSPKRVKEVLGKLKWPDYLTLDATQQAEYNLRIRGNLKVFVPRRSEKAGSSFVTIEFTDVNKDRAQEFLKALRTAWVEQVVERERTRYDVEFNKLKSRESELEKEYLNAVNELTELRNVNDISPTQPTPGQNAMRLEDPAFVRLGATRSRQDELEGELAKARQTLETASKHLAETEPEVPKTSVTQGLTFTKEIEQLNKEQLALEGQLEGIRPEHPRYKKITRQLEDLDTRKAALELKQTAEEVNLEFIPNPEYRKLESLVREAELDVEILVAEEDSLRKLELDHRRDVRRLGEALAQDTVISNRIEIIKKSMAETDIKLSESRQRMEVLYGPSANPFQVIQEVEPPSDPTQPSPALIILFSLVLGLGSSLGITVVLEITRSSFRGAADLNRVLMMPVLGVIGPIVTRQERNRLRVRRAALLSLSLALASSVLFITWSWENQPELLGDTLNDAIGDLRELFL